ncbi:bifunctional diguanylate cyclase/phosphodiesterase [Thioclava sp. SK-1]|uniref:putative bifunctional diguanylate cyclase/phosphodiesterase n=1 Tax=Thioclava sp. SK-1 TaxID=1889770 RepID=UPI00159F23D7|nr:EAL domain-containing protein [Thioclava sp. SK-1]
MMYPIVRDTPDFGSDLADLLDQLSETACALCSAQACVIDPAVDLGDMFDTVRTKMQQTADVDPAMAAAIKDMSDELRLTQDAQALRTGVLPRSGGVLRATFGGGLALYGRCLWSSQGEPLGRLTMVFAPRDAPKSDQIHAIDLLTDTIAGALEAFAERRQLMETLARSEMQAAALRRKSETDPLTRLENSASFEAKSRQRLTNDAQKYALIVLDIDHFKAINDLYGHKFGDTYLRSMAQALRTAVPDSAIIGRLGGDEFGILLELPQTSGAYLDGLIVRARAAVQRSIAILGKPDIGRVSMGVSLFPNHARDFNALFERADVALYVSKRMGRATSTIFDPHHHDRFNMGVINSRFRKALLQRQIVPFFQPIYDLASGARAGFEVLSRWDDPQQGILTPDMFPAAFNDHLLSEQLTRVMIDSALATITRAQAHQPELAKCDIAVNLTSFDLMNPEFVFDLQSSLSDHEVSWERITLEVTERVMLGDRNGQIYRTLSELRMRGAKVALDDFGTGYGGLRHLDDWPVDVLKIDRYFVQSPTSRPHARAVIEAMVSIARACGFQVVAEGVETAEQLHLVRDVGCDMAQGFIFSRPVSMAQMPQTDGQVDMAGLSA